MLKSEYIEAVDYDSSCTFHKSEYVSTSTSNMDCVYDDGTIVKHFKSWDEECQDNNEAIKDYEDGIKHFKE